MLRGDRSSTVVGRISLICRADAGHEPMPAGSADWSAAAAALVAT